MNFECANFIQTTKKKQKHSRKLRKKEKKGNPKKGQKKQKVGQKFVTY